MGCITEILLHVPDPVHPPLTSEQIVRFQIGFLLCVDGNKLCASASIDLSQSGPLTSYIQFSSQPINPIRAENKAGGGAKAVLFSP